MALLIPDGALATEEFVKKQIDELKAWMLANFKGGTTTEPDPIPDPEPQPEPKPEPEPEIPDLPKCDQGPDIKTVDVLGKRQIRVTFHGNNVFEINAFVPDARGENLVAYVTNERSQKVGSSGLFKPDSNTQILNLAADLSAGKHTVTYKATSCTGQSTREFEVFP